MHLPYGESDRSGKALATLILLTVSAQSEAGDAERAWSASIGVASDYTFRGVSQTMGKHAIQASVDVSLASGLYAYAWGSNVDFVPDNEPDDGAGYEIDLAIGYATDITDHWSVDLALIRYVFPGTVSDVNYDYNEFTAAIWYANTYSATVAFSGDVDGTGRDSSFYKLGASFDLSHDVSLDINYGYYDLNAAYGTPYAYVEAALARTTDNTTITLAYNDTQDSAEMIYGDRITGPRLVLSLVVEW